MAVGPGWRRFRFVGKNHLLDIDTATPRLLNTGTNFSVKSSCVRRRGRAWRHGWVHGQAGFGMKACISLMEAEHVRAWALFGALGGNTASTLYIRSWSGC